MEQLALRGAEKKSAAQAAHRERTKKGLPSRAEKRASKPQSMVAVLPAFEVALAAVNVGIRAWAEAKGALAEFMGRSSIGWAAVKFSTNAAPSAASHYSVSLPGAKTR
jgi:hypothetical protein